MSIGEEFLKEVDSEMTATRRLVARVPDDKVRWTPHPKSSAKDTQFPDDKLGWKPHPDARSVLEELRHVTIGLEMTSAQLRGEKFDFVAREKADASKPKTRAALVSEMEAAIAVSIRWWRNRRSRC